MPNTPSITTNRELWHVLLYTGKAEHYLFVVIAANADIATDMAIRHAIGLDGSITISEMFAYRCGDVALIGKWPH